jgi:hypothetical protein
VVGHEFRLAEADLDVRLDDGFRVAGDAVKTVGDGADLHAAELRVDCGAERHAHWHRGQRELSDVSSGIKHDLPSDHDFYLNWDRTHDNPVRSLREVGVRIC